ASASEESIDSNLSSGYGRGQALAVWQMSPSGRDGSALGGTDVPGQSPTEWAGLRPVWCGGRYRANDGSTVSGAGWVAISFTSPARPSAPADFSRYRPPTPVTDCSSDGSRMDASAITRAPTCWAASIAARRPPVPSWLRSRTRTTGWALRIAAGEKGAPLTTRSGDRPR